MKFPPNRMDSTNACHAVPQLSACLRRPSKLIMRLQLFFIELGESFSISLKLLLSLVKTRNVNAMRHVNVKYEGQNELKYGNVAN